MIEPRELAKLPFEQAAPLWLASHRVHVSERTAFDYERWIVVLGWFFHGVRLSEISISHLEHYQAARMSGELGPKKKKAGPVCINHELTTLRLILRRAGVWKALEEHYRPIRVLPSTRGCALSPQDEERLFRAAASKRRWRVAYLCSLITANTTAGPGEIRMLRLRDLNLETDPPTVHIREGTKNKYRNRIIPLNWVAAKAFRRLLERANRLGATKPDHFLLPHRADENHSTADPTRPMCTWRKAWERLRDAAGLPNLRMYDLRHHAITRFLENEQISERTVSDLAGHVSRAMLEKYSHIRMSTKKAAVDALNGPRVQEEPKPHPHKPKPPKPENVDPLAHLHEDPTLDVLREANERAS
jgi:integrase